MITPHHYEIVDESRHLEASTSQAFDRVAFALGALRALTPRRMTVAVYLRHGGMTVEQVRDPRRGPDATWATLGVAAHATPEQIAYTLAELAGLEKTPLAIASLIAAGASAVDGRSTEPDA